MVKMIDLDGTFNTRDIGGIVNKDGRKIRYGLMLRSDALNALSPDDVKFFEEFGLKTIVDFRMNKEAESAPNVEISGVKTVRLSPNAEVAALASGSIINDKEKIDALLEDVSTEKGRQELLSQADGMAEEMRRMTRDPYAHSKYSAFLDLLTDESSLPLLHHCKGGKDRTGFGAMITLFALDVDADTAREEYMLTKDCMAERNERRMDEYRQYTDNETVLTYLSGLMQTKEIYFDATVDEMEKMAGSIDAYLEKYLLLDDEKKEKIKKIFLED